MSQPLVLAVASIAGPFALVLGLRAGLYLFGKIL